MGATIKIIKPGIDACGLDPRKHKRAIETAQGFTATRAIQDYQSTTRTWKHKPSFRIAHKGDSVTVGTDDEIYGYVDKGTRPHTIRPRRAKVLRFSSGYRAKTTPGSLGSGSGGATGGAVYRRFVQHPGTKARRFTELVQKRADDFFPDEMQRQLAKVAARKG